MHRVPEHVIHRILTRDAQPAFTDDDCQLTLVVNLRGHPCEAAPSIPQGWLSETLISLTVDLGRHSSQRTYSL